MLKRLKTFHNNCPLTSFIIIIFISLFLSRYLGITLSIHPSISDFRLHHFYYGLILLSIAAAASLFTKIPKPILIVLSAISIGMIIDELILVFTLDKAPYTWQTFPETLLIATIFAVLSVILTKIFK